MNRTHTEQIAAELKIATGQVQATASLLEDGATVPFIARYRKEMTGGLDESIITTIRARLEQLQDLDKRRASILKSLETQGELTDILKTKIVATDALAELEDIYLPYRPKRRTRASIAREKGLEPLARRIFAQTDIDPLTEAATFVNPQKGVSEPADALHGARDIIAEWVNEEAEARAALRQRFTQQGRIRSKVIKGKELDGVKYRDYYDWEEPISTAPSHRILAIRRAANEGFLTYHIRPQEEAAIATLQRRFVRGNNAAAQQVRLAVEDSYKRLLAPSMETEIKAESKTRADEEAISIFADNLRHLLLAPPLGQKPVLALDPGLRTGCKIVCLDAQGQLMCSETIFPLQPHKRVAQSADTLKMLVEKYGIEAIAVGNGTGGREALTFCKSVDFGREVSVVMVNESGASVYSASEVAREEFPDADVTVRGAVSIGRRLVDALAELVKIEPRSIGVGQYQHDVDQKALKQSLDDAVVSCVNAVGVEVNTARKQLLRYVSGLSDRLAENIVAYRNSKEAFRSRKDLMNVPGMGPKTLQQAAGFLRIRGAENPLDASAVHPESYPVVEAMANNLHCSVSSLMQESNLRRRIQLERYVTDSVGMPTLMDIMEELAKPGRDPREPFELFTFTEGVNEIADLKVGMKLPGVVTNVTAFGAFVDIGVHRDGLVHISQLADRFVRQPRDVVKVHQQVTVTVIGLEPERNRIALSMRENPNEQR